MRQLKIGFLLHFFQPWWQFPDVLGRVIEECYMPIFEFVNGINRNFLFTANINYSLLKLFENNGYGDMVEMVKKALPKIELVGSTAHHPIMALIPAKEAWKQICQDNQKKIFMGIIKNSNGFFMPEMAFSGNALAVIKRLQYSWTIVDDVALHSDNMIPNNYIFKSNGLIMFLRSRHWSNYIAMKHLSFDDFLKKLDYEVPQWTDRQKPFYLILAMDAETFGHHVKHLKETFLFPFLSEWSKEGRIMRFEELAKLFPLRDISPELIEGSSWSTDKSHLADQDPYPLWKSRHNHWHDVYWKLIELALKHSDKPEAIHDCFSIQNSCHSWWISDRYWHPEFMKFGARKAMAIIQKCSVEKNDLKNAEEYFDVLNALK